MLYLLTALQQIPSPEKTFLEAGILGACVVVLLGAVGFLFRVNQQLHKENQQLHKESSKAYSEQLTKNLTEAMELRHTLDRLVEGLAARDLLLQLAEKQGLWVSRGDHQ